MAIERRARLVSVVLLGLTFGAGVLFGMALDAGGPGPLAPEPPPQQAGAPVGGEDETPAGDADAAAAEERPRQRGPVIYELGLTDAQRERVDEIVRHFRRAMHDLDDEYREDYNRRRRELLASVRDSIKTVLHPTQVEEYESLLAERYGSDGNGGGARGATRRGDGPRDGEGERR